MRLSLLPLVLMVLALFMGVSDAQAPASAFTIRIECPQKPVNDVIVSAPNEKAALTTVLQNLPPLCKAKLVQAGAAQKH